MKWIFIDCNLNFKLRKKRKIEVLYLRREKILIILSWSVGVNVLIIKLNN